MVVKDLLAPIYADAAPTEARKLSLAMNAELVHDQLQMITIMMIFQFFSDFNSDPLEQFELSNCIQSVFKALSFKSEGYR